MHAHTSKEADVLLKQPVTRARGHLEVGAGEDGLSRVALVHGNREHFGVGAEQVQQRSAGHSGLGWPQDAEAGGSGSGAGWAVMGVGAAQHPVDPREHPALRLSHVRIKGWALQMSMLGMKPIHWSVITTSMYGLEADCLAVTKEVSQSTQRDHDRQCTACTCTSVAVQSAVQEGCCKPNTLRIHQMKHACQQHCSHAQGCVQLQVFISLQ